MERQSNLKSAQVKKFYRLWWEYLNRSDVYKELCEKIRMINRLRKAGSLIPKEGNLQLIDDAVSKGYYAVTDAAMAGPEYDSEFYMLHKYYPHFGDVFVEVDFENIWDRIIRFQRNERPDFIKWESERIGESFGFARLTSKTITGQRAIELGSERAYPLQIKLDEDRFPLGDMGAYLCYVDFKADAEQILDDFKNFINLNWKNFHTPIRPQFLSRVPNSANTENLWRYLKVLDARLQGIQDKFIAESLLAYAREDRDSPEALNQVQREYGAAKNVIWNVEHGIFPKVTR